MRYAEAFSALGYDLRSPRTDWSAAHEASVCISLWANEIRYADGRSSFDTRRDAQPIENWNRKPGFKRRNEHLRLAIDRLAGRIDVVVVSGVPGGAFGHANPWIVAERGAEWRVMHFDARTGHFVAEVRTV